MDSTILSRNSYDVRFLDIPETIPQSSWKSYIDTTVHTIYPGNNGAYDYVYRALNNFSVIIIFVEKRTLLKLKIKHPIIPALLLPIILKKRQKLEILYLYAHGNIEAIHFKDDSPKRSQLLRSVKPLTNGYWMFLTSPDESCTLPPKDKILPIPKFKNQCHFKKIESKRHIDITSLLIKLLIILIIFCGVLFQYTKVTEVELKKQSLQQQQLQKISHRKIVLTNEIVVLENQQKTINTFSINNPYEVLISLFDSVGQDIKIQSITIQRDSFSIDCYSPDPIYISGILSSNTHFSDVSIQRIKEEEGTYHFFLIGNFNG